jgi:hypothetical protein
MAARPGGRASHIDAGPAVDGGVVRPAAGLPPPGRRVADRGNRSSRHPLVKLELTGTAASAQTSSLMDRLGNDRGPAPGHRFGAPAPYRFPRARRRPDPRRHDRSVFRDLQRRRRGGGRDPVPVRPPFRHRGMRSLRHQPFTPSPKAGMGPHGREDESSPRRTPPQRHR